MKLNRKVTALIISFTALVSISSVFCVQPALADDSIGLATTKNTFDVETMPGETYRDNLTIFNQSSKVALPVHAQLSMWDLNDTTNQIEFVNSESGSDPTKWFTMNTTDTILPPSGDKEIDFTIMPPKDTPPGSYLVMMRFQAVLPDYYFSQNGPRFLPELGVLFFIKVSALTLEGNQIPYQADVLSVTPQGSQSIGWLGQIFAGQAKADVFDDAVKTLVAKIQNNGIYFFKSSGYLEIKNMLGVTVARTDLNQIYLLPGRSRDLAISVLPPPADSGSMISNLYNYIVYTFKENSYMGPYSAVLTLNVPGQPPVVTNVSFWVVPWKFWIPVIAAVYLLFYILIRFRHRLSEAFDVLIGRKILR